MFWIYKVLRPVQEINLAHYPVPSTYSTEREKGERKDIFFYNRNMQY